MRRIFADTSYWIALIDRNDRWHKKAISLSKSLGRDSLVTTDEVLTEVLTFFSGYGPQMRKSVAQIAFNILTNKHNEVIEQSRTSFLTGLELYEKRLDKDYSLTDCISMQTMREEKLTEVLTNDHHFRQEGFTILLKD